MWSKTQILFFDMDLRRAWHGMGAYSAALKLANVRRKVMKQSPLF